MIIDVRKNEGTDQFIYPYLGDNGLEWANGTCTKKVAPKMHRGVIHYRGG